MKQDPHSCLKIAMLYSIFTLYSSFFSWFSQSSPIPFWLYYQWLNRVLPDLFHQSCWNLAFRLSGRHHIPLLCSNQTSSTLQRYSKLEHLLKLPCPALLFRFGPNLRRFFGQGNLKCHFLCRREPKVPDLWSEYPSWHLAKRGVPWDLWCHFRPQDDASDL